MKSVVKIPEESNSEVERRRNLSVLFDKIDDNKDYILINKLIKEVGRQSKENKYSISVIKLVIDDSDVATLYLKEWLYREISCLKSSNYDFFIEKLKRRKRCLNFYNTLTENEYRNLETIEIPLVSDNPFDESELNNKNLNTPTLPSLE